MVSSARSAVLALLVALPSAALADPPEADAEKPEWDVMHPPGEPRTVAIDTRTGTWMAVDVHPDGDRVVFDLLGDLYEMPLGGGEARALTSGMAWDMQPRYRPDGKSVAFTSDRGGGENLWVLPLDGGEPWAVTEEDYRLVNSPAWSPDGAWLAGRKHFTKSRSLGAGEIWLWSLTGGDGLQLTERANDEKDLGEPAFSPDGRWVYFSRDATPGEHFEYNKDANGEIYVIDRLDRTDGRIEQVVGGAGGAVRPTPHPDGEHLAYVRRDRDHSVLMLHDLRSGAERRLWDGLDRDMQETWAIHGVYPAMAWLPDGTGLVVWAQGKLWRVSIGNPDDTGLADVAEIPFHVADTREVRDAVRFPVQVAPESFDVKMPRWPVVSPDGDRVVFEALGVLWSRDLPDGEARRLTKQSDHLELMPTWSRDGKSIAFVTWDDADLGSVRVVSAKGAKEEVLTTEPGHYFAPAFSPDGERVAFRKGGGGWLTSARWSADPGLYVVDRRGGTPERVSRDGSAPHFGADAERLYYLTAGEDEGAELWSVGLVDREHRAHARSAMGTNLRVSPDGRYLAFQEQHNAWVTPFVPTGRAVDVGPDSTAAPVVQVSRDAGDYLQFSGDSARLHWSTGPSLFTADLAPAFARLEAEARGGDKEEEDEGEDIEGLAAERVDIGFSVPLSRPEGTVALVGARLVTMRGDEVIEDGTIVWEADRIVAVGPRADVAVPTGATVLDGAGLTAFPGLIDVHAHGSQNDDAIVPEQNWLMQAALAFGVTTLHDPSNETEPFFAASERQKAGTLLAPRLFSTGTILYGAKSPGYTAEIETLDDALSHLRRLQAKGAFSVKSYQQPRREQRQMVLEAARQLHMMVVPEGGSLLANNLTQVVDGHTGVEHAIPVARAYDDVLQLWSHTQVGYTPTLGVAYGGIMGEWYWYAHTDVWNDERLLSFVPKWVIDPIARRRPIAPEEEYNHVDAAKFAAALQDAGGHVQLGAHGQREGLAAHWELWMMEQGGMTPLEALRAGTIEGARYLGMDGDLGSLEPGKLADIAVVAGNPLDDLRLSREVKYTVLGGRVYDAATLQSVAPAGPPRDPFWWQEEGTALPSPMPSGPTCSCGMH